MGPELGTWGHSAAKVFTAVTDTVKGPLRQEVMFLRSVELLFPHPHPQEEMTSALATMRVDYDQVKIKDLKTSNNRLLNKRRQAGGQPRLPGLQQSVAPATLGEPEDTLEWPEALTWRAQGPVVLTKELFVLCCNLSLGTSDGGT